MRTAGGGDENTQTAAPIRDTGFSQLFYEGKLVIARGSIGRLV